MTIRVPVLTTTLLLAMMASMIYPGGKERAAARIINLMPPHTVYMEPFAGAGAVYRAKRPAELSILVDLDPQVIERWKVPELGSGLAGTGVRCRCGPSEVAEPASLAGAGQESQPAGNGVVRSIRPLRALDLTGSIHAEPGVESGQGPCKTATLEMAKVDANGRRTEFRFGDGIEFLKRYPFTGAELVYCDPPYPMETRSSGRLYHCEMTDAQHRELLKVIAALPCKVIISGYSCPMYQEALVGWRSESYRTMTRGGETREWLWFNFSRPADGNGSGARLHDYAKLGNGYREQERIRRKATRWKGRLERLPQHERVILTAFAQADTRGRERLQRKIDRWTGSLNRLNKLERRALLTAIGDPAISAGVAGKPANSNGGGLPSVVRT